MKFRLEFTVPAIIGILCLPAVAALLAAPAVAGAGLVLSPVAGQDYVVSQGSYVNHLQGVTTNGADAIYWSFTDRLVKTDTAGNIVKSVEVRNHHGDLTFANGNIYVAVNDVVTIPRGEFNVENPANPDRQWVYQYNATTLERTAAYNVPKAIYGAGGIAYHDGRFLIVGGLAPDQTSNFVYEYDSSFNWITTHKLDTGYTDRGIQTVEFAHGHWWFGTYQNTGGSRQIYKFDESLSSFTTIAFDASLGIAAMPDGHFLIGRNQSTGNGYVGRVHVAALDPVKGLVLVPVPVPEPSSQSIVLIGLATLGGFGLLHQRKRIATALARLRTAARIFWPRLHRQPTYVLSDPIAKNHVSPVPANHF